MDTSARGALATGLTQDITAWLREASSGNLDAEANLLQALYHDLHRLARRHLRNERLGHTLGATALVHEAYMRLMRGQDNTWNNRVHFFATASNVMRRLLVDHARRRATVKRGEGVVAVALDDVPEPRLPHSPERLLAIDEALTELARQEPRQAQVVEMRFFAGMTDDEIAAALGISSRTVKREWAVAKVWLYAYLKA